MPSMASDSVSRFLQARGSINNELKSDKKNNKEEENINNDKIIFNIPILWNGCDEFKNIFIEHLENNCFDKKLFTEHWCNCKKCEIIDNNDI
jgi:hypothetical protein